MFSRKDQHLSSPPSQLAMLAVACVLLLPTCPPLAANSPVHTDPLNYDPLVKEASSFIYDLDYDGGLIRLEKLQAAHPTNPLATAYLLDCILYRELYRLDLLDTTF